MNVNGVYGNNQNAGVDQSAWKSRMQQAFAPVAQLFGESSDQLESELQTSGASLSSLASQKGISQTDLVNAIKQGIQSTANGSPLSDNQLTNIANRIANHTHGHHHHHKASSTDDQAAATQPAPASSDSTIATTL